MHHVLPTGGFLKITEKLGVGTGVNLHAGQQLTEWPINLKVAIACLPKLKDGHPGQLG